MSFDVLLDAGPLGLVTQGHSKPDAEACRRWLANLAAQGHRIWVPAIADYEVRRELIRAGKVRGVERLDALIRLTRYLAITPKTLRLAARFWAEARSTGLPTAEAAALDADMILAAQAARVARGNRLVVVATTNARHLAPFCDARSWASIS